MYYTVIIGVRFISLNNWREYNQESYGPDTDEESHWLFVHCVFKDIAQTE